MKFWKPIIFPCLLASRIISTDAAFIKGSSVKTLEDTVECPRSGSSFSSQYNLFSHNNDLPPSMEKHSQVEQSNALLAKYQDTAPIAMSSKRSFNNAFGNGEGEPANIPHIMNEPYFSPPFSANRGDDLMLFSTERDIFPTYTTELLSPEILCDYATTLEGSEHSYCDYGYLQNNFLWENNNWLISQPEHIGDLSGINSRGAAETEHQSLGYSSMPVDLPLNTLIGTETTAGLGGNSFSSLENKLRVTIEGETSKLDGDDQSDSWSREKFKRCVRGI
ncbi:hypothetical protein BY996DRAFT_6410025 [Phakopsora pachyrhizi]|nr:hypothetical protein BY996DRAFT_6410025 [Phakopsora pachyrhizi]